MPSAPDAARALPGARREQAAGEGAPGEDPARSADDALRALPAVDAVLRELPALPGGAAAARAVLARLREGLRDGTWPGRSPPDARAVAALAADEVRRWGDLYPRAVNATGILLHTGLGRAPLAVSAAAALAEVASGFQVLEVEAASGHRDERERALLAPLLRLTGAQAATVVNNNAGALLLAVTALAEGRDVLVSRGELIEIGGGFRLPELLARSGARLCEVGTTNRTYAADYAARLTWETGLLLRMHTSNYRVVGFQHTPARRELVALAAEHGVPVVEDVGSGLLSPLPGAGLDDEPDVASALAEGVDLVLFSGDKLLGGPQAGLLVGRDELVRRCRRHPLFRALRPDRLCLTALAATLALHEHARDDVPVLSALRRSPAERKERARALAAALAARLPAEAFPGGGPPRLAVVDTEAFAGSGSAPARPLSSAAVALDWPGLDAATLAARLRTGTPAVFAAEHRGRVCLDVLALLPGDEARLLAAFAALAG